MGTCNKCGSEISLKDNEKNCPTCGKAPYNCWNCKQDITGETRECAVCHFFICPSCGKCGTNCKLPGWINELKQIEGKTA